MTPGWKVPKLMVTSGKETLVEAWPETEAASMETMAATTAA